MSGLNVILRSSQTVFTFNDICLLLTETNKNLVMAKVSYYVRKKQLIRIRKGIYAKNNDYNKFELASKIYTPSYISFETVLTEEGINFQYYNEIKLASYLNRKIKIGENFYKFTKIKNSILINTQGIENKDNINRATKERALLDTLYAYGDYHFDNLDSIDWTEIFKILPIYDNKRMIKNINNLYAKYQQT